MTSRRPKQKRPRGGVPRPGRLGWQTWVIVRAMMNVQNLGPLAAARLLLRPDSEYRDVVRSIERRCIPRSTKSLKHDYHEAERLRKADRALADDCAFWLPVFELAVRERINPFEALKRLELFESSIRVAP